MPPDRLRIDRTYFPKIKLTDKLKERLRLLKFLNRKLSYVYDTKKALYYANLLNFYNTNFFGYGVFGNPTNYNPTTLEGQNAILLNYDYAKGNMIDFTTNLGLGYLGFRFKPLVGKGNNGNIEAYLPFIIGDGAESIVIDNSPTTVAKVSLIPIEEMELKNTVPGVSKSKYVGTMTVEGNEYPVYVQDKVKVIDESKLKKNSKKLKDILFRGKYRPGIEADGGLEVFYNRNYVVDDLGVGNVGIDRFGNLKIIDLNIRTLPELSEWGFGPILGNYKIPNYIY